MITQSKIKQPVGIFLRAVFVIFKIILDVALYQMVNLYKLITGITIKNK